MHLCKVLFVKIAPDPDIGQFRDSVECIGCVNEFANDDILFDDCSICCCAENELCEMAVFLFVIDRGDLLIVETEKVKILFVCGETCLGTFQFGLGL